MKKLLSQIFGVPSKAEREALTRAPICTCGTSGTQHELGCEMYSPTGPHQEGIHPADALLGFNYNYPTEAKGDWEVAFDEKFGVEGTTEYWKGFANAIKSFIKELLTSERTKAEEGLLQRILTELESRKRNNDIHYDFVLSEVIELIKRIKHTK